MQNHNENIDILKGLACLMVVFIHSFNIFAYIGINNVDILQLIMSPVRMLTKLGVPIFFIVSGYLSKNTLKKMSYKDMVIRKAKILLIPYLLWNAIYMVFELLGYFILPDAFEDLTSITLGGILIKLLGIPFMEPPIYEPLWFVRTLFLIFLFLPLLIYITEKVMPQIVVMMILAVMFIQIPVLYNSGYFFNCSVPFFLIGLMYATYKEKVSNIFQKIYKYKHILLIVMVVLAYLDGYIYFLIKGRIHNFGITYHILDMITILIMTYIVYMIIIRKNLNNKLRQTFIFISGYSFMIYVLHGKILSILQVLSVKLIYQNYFIIILEFIVYPIIAIAISIAFAYIIKKYMKIFYNLLTGGR